LSNTKRPAFQGAIQEERGSAWAANRIFFSGNAHDVKNVHAPYHFSGAVRRHLCVYLNQRSHWNAKEQPCLGNPNFGFHVIMTQGDKPLIGAGFSKVVERTTS
jgi:hypothetical protein